MNAELDVQEILKEQGLTPIGTRWIFTNKGDGRLLSRADSLLQRESAEGGLDQQRR